MCPKCGNYSLANDAIRDLETGTIAFPNPQAFLAWLKDEEVHPDLANQGPLVSTGSIRHWAKKP